MLKILLAVVLPENTSEALSILDYIRSKHPGVAISDTVADRAALIELVGKHEMATKDAASELKRGLKVNNCRIWHEHTIRGRHD